MSVRHERITVATERREETVDITARVKAAVTRAKIADGIVAVTVAHTTAGVFVNENADPDVRRDLLTALERAVPREAKYAATVVRTIPSSTRSSVESRKAPNGVPLPDMRE